MMGGFEREKIRVLSGISIGGSLARACFNLVRCAALEMLEHGSFAYAAE